MATTMRSPDIDQLTGVLRAMAGWTCDDDPVPLHPGDLGWAWRLGAETVATAVRTWYRDGELSAAGFLDGPAVLRTAVAPSARDDDELARAVHADLADPGRGVLPAGAGDVEVRAWPALHDRLMAGGWTPGEPWTPLLRDLGDAVPAPGMDVEVVTAERAAAWTAVHRAAFGLPPTTDTDRWAALAAGPAWAGATCLLGHDRSGTAVASAVVWSAGVGRPGLVEPLGVHPDHRGRRHGVAITRAALAALRAAGASQAWVATPAANRRAVAAYVAAGFVQLPDVRDVRRA